MDGDHGAINHLEHGEVGTAINDIETSVRKFFVDDVSPVLTTFLKQFLSDFGSQALSQAAALAPGIISGATTIQEAAVTLVGQVTADAATDAEKDGTVALNALRVQIEASKATAS